MSARDTHDELEAHPATTINLRVNVEQMVMQDCLLLLMDLTGKFPQRQHSSLVVVVVSVQSKRQGPCKADTDVRTCRRDCKESSSSSAIACCVRPARATRRTVSVTVSGVCNVVIQQVCGHTFPKESW